ncbi:TnsD family Tn7-like transposition protein [Aeromonas caviae]|uniref:TnsD family Tn7-like transposition protein n=1 Tax=Aeromonas caviae TaxID=648 RepID=UPI001378AAFE|nr:TnsD family Tn7-like transposition protein [Aeromonas caviae]NBA16102.1 hypothetical protein [Aeromonas caviae]
MRLPSALPDELLIGRLIRHVTVSGDEVGSLSTRIWGTSRISIHPYLTAGLIQLAAATGEDKEVLLNEQTLAPLFFLFHPSHAKRFKKFLFANEGAKALRESQLPSFGCGSSLFLKWCPLCAQRDLTEHGVSYWRRSHQIIGVTACFEHSVLLQRVVLDRRQRVIVGLLPTHTGCLQSASSIEVRVAEFSHSLIQQLSHGIPLLDISAIYRLRLAELGYITAGERVRRKILMRHFTTAVERYRPCQDCPLPQDEHDYRYMSQLLESGISHHPFRHLLFASWLFREPRELLEFAPSPRIIYTQPMPACVDERQKTEQKCLILLREKCSMAEVCQLTGKSRCYLKRLASLHRIPLNLKPKTLTQEINGQIVQLARKGIHRKSIAQQCGIGIGSVEQVISSEPGLVEWRRRCHWESKRRRCFAQIARFRQQHPKAIRQEIKTQCKAAYSWLYLNDRGLFDDILPKPLKAVGRAYLGYEGLDSP